MPTATKKKSLVTQVADLDAEIKKARLETARLRREINDFDDASRALDAALVVRRESHPEEHEPDGYAALPDTETARLHEELKERVESPNPFQAQRAKAVTHLHGLEQSQRRLKITEAPGLAVEIAGTDEHWTREFQEPFRVLAEVIDRYRRSLDGLQRFTHDVPAISGQDVVYDGRVEQWANFLGSAIDTAVIAPHIGEMGQYHLNELRDRLERGEDV